MSNIIPRDTHLICQHWFDGDFDAARTLQMRTLPLIKALFAEVNPIPVKQALNLLGWEVGGLRLPLVTASAATTALLAQALEEYGVRGI
jgi:4-hydroxy-tetrahydrodipicolinate synthase